MQNNALKILANQPESFEFCAAVRLLELVGFLSHESFTANLLPAEFPIYRSYDVNSFKYHNGHATLVCNVECVIGGFGIAPRYFFEEYVYYNDFPESNNIVTSFFKSINQRFYELYYETTIAFNLCIQTEREILGKGTIGKNNKFSVTDDLASLSGARRDMVVPAMHMIQYGSLMGQRLTCPFTLGVILSDYFGMNCKISCEDIERCALTESTLSVIGCTGKNNALGLSMVAGKWGWIAYNTLQIVINVSSTEEFQKIQLDTDLSKAMVFLTEFYFGGNVFPQLFAKVPVSCFSGITFSSGMADNEDRVRLGINSCLVRKNTDRNESRFVMVRIS